MIVLSLPKNCLLYHKKIPRVRTDREEKVREIPRKRSNIFPHMKGRKKGLIRLSLLYLPAEEGKGKLNVGLLFYRRKRPKRYIFTPPVIWQIFLMRSPPPLPLSCLEFPTNGEKRALNFFKKLYFQGTRFPPDNK